MSLNEIDRDCTELAVEYSVGILNVRFCSIYCILNQLLSSLVDPKASFIRDSRLHLDNVLFISFFGYKCLLSVCSQ